MTILSVMIESLQTVRINTPFFYLFRYNQVEFKGRGQQTVCANIKNKFVYHATKI